MAAYFTLTLDTLAPGGVSLSINSGAAITASTAVSLAIGCSDSSTGGYSMKVYGDINTGANSKALTAADVSWETYTAEKSVTLLTGDGSKTVKLLIRDDVYNVSSEVTDSITLDTTVPVVTITGPDVSKISLQTGKRTATFSFVSGEAFTEYKVKVVPSASSLHSTGTLIGTAGGSTNMSGAGTFAANASIACAVSGSDYSAAVGASDGAYIAKVFVRDASGNWSV